jgi:hypothetical protein
VTRERAGVAALTLAALALFFLAPTYPNYDAYYHLVWGRELLDGHAPGFEAYKAPTQHPLELAVAAVLGVVFGDWADRAVVLMSVLSLVALVWAVFRLGLRVFGVWPALAGAFFAGSSFSLLLLAARGYVDVPFLALIFWAAVRVAEERRDGPTVVLLVLAGLLRPEAWVLAGLFALWRRSVPLLFAAAAAPVIWCLVDLVVTGDPIRSLTGTSELAEELGRERGIAKVPGAFVEFVADALRLPVAAAALAGLVLAWRWLGPRRLIVPLGLLATGTIAFVGTGVAGLSILPRYLTVPVVTLCLFAGYAALGFTTLAPGRVRRWWTAGACVIAVGGLVFVAVRAHVVDRLTTELAFIDGTHSDLDALLATREVRAAARCGPISFPNYRLVPDARWILDLPEGDVVARSAYPRGARPRRGAAVFVVGRKALRRYGFADGASPLTNSPDPGFVLGPRRGRFVAYLSC